jgi:hypothetical protein
MCFETMRYRIAALILLSLDLACGAAAVEPMRPKPSSASESVARAKPLDARQESSNPFERRQNLTALLAAAEDVLNSPEFQNHLAAVDELATGYEGASASGRKVLEQLLNTRLPLSYSRDKKGHETADTSFHMRCGSTALQQAVVDEWIDGGTVQATLTRSCAINTIVHEWTHILPAADGSQWIVDNNHTRSHRPMASYAVGAVAQCASLERAKEIVEDDFWPCVDYVGTNVFNGKSVCGSDLTWLGSLKTRRTAR